jgi:hypothetical protein
MTGQAREQIASPCRLGEPQNKQMQQTAARAIRPAACS